MFNPNVSKVYPGLTDFFHAGAVWSWLAVKWLDVRGVWGVLPQLALAYYLVPREEQAERVLTPAQIREQEVLAKPRNWWRKPKSWWRRRRRSNFSQCVPSHDILVKT